MAELAELAGQALLGSLALALVLLESPVLALLESLVLALLESLVEQANIPQYEGVTGRIQEESFQLPGVSAKL